MLNAKEFLEKKSLNKIIVYLKQNINDLAQISASTIARVTGISVPSVIRFFQSNGFRNFADFKFQYIAISKINNLENVEKSVSSYGLTIKKNIDQLFEINDAGIFGQAADIIIASRSVSILASGGTYAFAHELNQKLNELGVDSLAVQGPSSNLIRMVNGGSSHLLIIISYSMKHKAYQQLIENAIESESKLIIIAAEHITKYDDYATLKIKVNQDEGSNMLVLYSNIELLLINYLLANEIFQKNIEKYSKILEKNKAI